MKNLTRKNFLTKLNSCFENRHYLLAILLILFNLKANSSEIPFYINGRILSAENSEPISNAVIEIVEQKIYTTSKNDGTFTIGPINFKKFRIKVTHLAFQEKLIDIEIKSESNKNIVIYLIPRILDLSPLIISDKKTTDFLDELQEYNAKLSGKSLHQKLGQTIAQTLKNETGISVRSMGPAPSRPIFRGLGQDRIVITEDGMKSIDLSATSPDHAVTIEPFVSERIEVLRGPKILTQTSTTIGGLINVVQENIPSVIHNTPHFTFGSYFESANHGMLGSIKTGIPLNPFQIKFDLVKRKTSDLTTPIGKLKNSSSENFNGSAGISYIKDFGFIGGSLKTYELNYGIPGGFIGAHPLGVNIKIFKKQYALSSRIKTNNSENFFNIDFRNDYYRHKEFEHSGLIGSEFKIITNSLKIIYEHENGKILKSGEFGLSIEHRDFDIGGYVFTPPTQSANVSLFLYEDFHLKDINLETALRLSYDVVNPSVKKLSSRIGQIRKREFFNISAAASLIYQISNVVFIGANLSRSTRVPTIEELFSEGPHLAAYSFEVGNPDLNSERGWGTEIFVYHKFENLDFNLNAFYNFLNSYIIPRNTGDTNYQTFLPIYKTFGENVTIYGFEGSIKIKLMRDVFLQSSISHTTGKFRNSKKPLPQIPPTKGLNQIYFNNEKLTFGISNEWALAQNRVDIFEQPTAGYGIFSFYGQTIFALGKFVSSISINIENIFNKEYRNHLSRIKSIYPEAGRNFRITFKLFV